MVEHNAAGSACGDSADKESALGNIVADLVHQEAVLHGKGGDLRLLGRDDITRDTHFRSFRRSDYLCHFNDYAVAGSARMMAIFLKVDKDGSAYRVKEVYIPEQNCNTAHCIIADAELRKLGAEYTGLCRTGYGTKIDFSKDDIELFDKSFRQQQAEAGKGP